MPILFWVVFSTFLLSLISLIGILTISLSDYLLNRLLLVLVALSAGALLGGAFLHLIPEAAEELAIVDVLIYVLAGFFIFLLIEKILHWRHCHEGKCEVHTFAYMNLVGESVHNFLDGLIIAASFVVNVKLGVVTTLMMALHEIPQEIGDFGVLVYGGFSRFKALVLNFITALTAILGGLIGYFWSAYTSTTLNFLLPLAAGGFIYIGASDLIPEIKKETNFPKSLLYLGIFVLGILLMYGLKQMGGV